MKLKLLTCGLLSAIALTGCGQEEPIKTVEYYLQNADERKSKIAYCKDSADRRTETNCINAHDAQAKEDRRIMLNEGFPRSKSKK